VSNSKFRHKGRDAGGAGQGYTKTNHPADRGRAIDETDFEKAGLDDLYENGAYTNGMMGF